MGTLTKEMATPVLLIVHVVCRRVRFFCGTTLPVSDFDGAVLKVMTGPFTAVENIYGHRQGAGAQERHRPSACSYHLKLKYYPPQLRINNQK